MDREEITRTLQWLGMELLRPEVLSDHDATPMAVLTAQGVAGPAFSHVLTFDAEMIADHGDYADWVRQWATATGKSHLLSDVDDRIDFDGGTSWLSYTLDGRTTRVEFVQDGDYLDPEVAATVEEDFSDVPGRTRVRESSGQTGAFAWVPDDTVDAFLEFIPALTRG